MHSVTAKKMAALDADYNRREARGEAVPQNHNPYASEEGERVACLHGALMEP